MIEPVLATIAVGSAELTTARWGAETPSIVMLHDGLGSVAQWREVPATIAARTGRTVFAYDRAGHGASTPVPTGPWPADWLHREALVLGELIAVLGLEKPTLVGHSDGASIALLHAAAARDAVGAVVALAPHSWVEAVCVDAIEGMRLSPAPIIAGLARFHADPVAVFDAWSGVWTSEEFASWDVRAALGSVTASTLVAQGIDDAYATEAQARETVAAIGENAECRFLDGVGHLMHHDDADAVVGIVAMHCA